MVTELFPPMGTKVDQICLTQVTEKRKPIIRRLSTSSWSVKLIFNRGVIVSKKLTLILFASGR